MAFTSIPLGIPDDWVWTRITEFPGFPLYELIAIVLFLAMNFISRIMLIAALLIMTGGSSRNLGLNTVLLGFSIPALILFLGQHDVFYWLYLHFAVNSDH
ncbi:MAG: hypothetical protein KAS17_04670 [Victivallaceae bacterium]|nr:hypothetical protein [Victivallaceae bacterium]